MPRTMQVHHSGFPGQIILINTEDFDPSVHSAIDATAPAAAEPEAKPKGKAKKAEG